ncbi:MAG TPA: ABC transporter permease [Thermoplasmata archaeon]|nr:ABC transporter permease [Thermoplasmata archaeon]
MNRILADLLSFGRQYMRSRVGAFFTFIFPILLILLFGAIFTQGGSGAFTLTTQDIDNTTLSHAYIDALNNTGLVHISLIPNNVNLETYIRDNSLTVALRIPWAFEQDVIACRASPTHCHVNLTLYGDPSKSTFGSAQGLLQAVAQQMNFQLANASAVVGVDVKSVASSQYSYMDYFLPGIVGMTVMTTSMYSMTSICGEYRTRRYFKLLATTTLRKYEWLTSKILWYILSLVLSLFVTVAVGMLVWDVHVVIDPIALAFIAVGALLFTSLGMLFGTVVRDPESGVAVANAIGFPMMFLSGSFWPLEQMPSYLQTVSKALPLTYLNTGLRDTMVFGNTGSALLNLAIVSALAAALFLLAAKLVSWKER